MEILVPTTWDFISTALLGIGILLEVLVMVGADGFEALCRAKRINKLKREKKDE